MPAVAIIPQLRAATKPETQNRCVLEPVPQQLTIGLTKSFFSPARLKRRALQDTCLGSEEGERLALSRLGSVTW
ncbi:hypothetical protein AMECASPLE_026453 [Ameca splendens]|uniref:Uncharacterized protein n=1 Tax=Ameca splendens TaxID=208324 RepID=A0ABV0Y584_9TELE